MHAVCFSEIPPHLGLPSIHSGDWDPFFAACQETQHGRVHAHRLVVADAGDVGRRAGRGRRDAELQQRDGVALATSSSPACSCASRTLKLAYSEGQIGWIPYILERADDVWREHRAWGGVKDIVPEPPSTYYYRQVYGCFFRDRHGLESLDRVGVDNITFETDYPHTDSTWPDTKAVAEELMGHLPGRRRLQDHARQRDPHAQPRPRLLAARARPAGTFSVIR